MRIDADLGRRKLGLFLANDVKKPFGSVALFFKLTLIHEGGVTFILNVAGRLGRRGEVGGVRPLEGLHDLAKRAAPLLAGGRVVVRGPLAD